MAVEKFLKSQPQPNLVERVLPGVKIVRFSGDARNLHQVWLERQRVGKEDLGVEKPSWNGRRGAQ